jgi:opacity protein-like surface antigen
MIRNLSRAAIMLLLSIGLIHSFALPSVAADPEPKQYLLLKLGGYFPQSNDMNDYNDGFNGEIYYGRYFHKNFSSELGAGYFKSDSNDTSLGDVTIKTFDILYNIKGIYRIGRLELFAGPGVGLYFTKGYEFSSGSTTEWKPAFGYHVLAGCSFDVSTEWFLGLEGKYFWATTQDPIIPQGGAFGTHLDGLVGTATLGWRF